ncbi:hypothetical protein PILCRDRAFT_819402 [Piloderma croceum F 1598]|uniref:Uncharacterized protein n=1 Tax=Piloderma croceum (strain F 1598) TaxID=765440 RepID=A0A0C3C0V1_PILCF|nr:hypothetical protein PILCRDRAFT_819402 [Piloderma croceum F 1598]
MSSLTSLPGDLLLEIAGFLELRSDLLHFSVSSSTLYSNVVSALYSSVVLDTSRQCINTLTMLHRHPEITRHIQTLLVRPNGGRQTTTGVGGYRVCSAIRQIARQLDALSSFFWDWEEGIPPSDELWFALRMSCPQLRTIGTSVGGRIPNHHLFGFHNLLGFSLIFKPNLHQNASDETLPAQAALASSRLWDMLISRCPDLEELSIEGFSIHSIDARRLVQGRWPNLRKMTLGDVIVDLNLNPVNPDPTLELEKLPSIEFLEAHPRLQSLRTSQHVLAPAHLSSLSASSFPDLIEFSGTLEQLQTLAPSHPHSHRIDTSRQLKSVGFHQPMVMREVTHLAVCNVLQGLENLTTLSISFVLHSIYESGSLLRSLVGSCPRLERLDLGCGHMPSFTLDSFSKAIQHLRRLHTLSIALVKFPSEDSLSTNAGLIARANPRLRHFTITFIPRKASIFLPLPRPLTSHPFAYLESGTYTLMTDEHGLPVCLSAVERIGQASSWGWHFGFDYGLSAILGGYLGGGEPCVKRYRIYLRPGVRSTGLMSWVGLVTEQSRAGEELRLLVLMMVLLCLTAWGFLIVGMGRKGG